MRKIQMPVNDTLEKIYSNSGGFFRAYRVVKNPITLIYEKKLIKEVIPLGVPKHVAIIMDGNRRFAKRRGMPPSLGHIFGSKKAEDVLDWCWSFGIRCVTIYAFSTENFRRSEEEKRNLFTLIAKELRRMAKDKRVHKNHVKVKVVGKIELLPDYVRKAIEEVEKATLSYGKFYLNIAIAYGGRQELIDAIKKLLYKVKAGEISSEEITEDLLENNLYGEGDYPKVDLIIRTGGEQRLSNFLPWQTANSVACFLDVYWPEFRKIDLLRAIRLWQAKAGIR